MTLKDFIEEEQKKLLKVLNSERTSEVKIFGGGRIEFYNRGLDTMSRINLIRKLKEASKIYIYTHGSPSVLVPDIEKFEQFEIIVK